MDSLNATGQQAPIPASASEAIGAFVRYLKSTHHKHAFQISGSWGSGKTHLYRAYLRPQCEELGFRSAYVSLAGLKTLEHIEQAILYAIYPLLNSKAAKFSGGLLRGALRHAKFDLDEVFKLEARIDRKTCICFDDLERFDHDNIGAALGKISDLLESKEARVLILCDESKLAAAPSYSTAKEKVVGRTYRFNPTPEHVVGVAFDIFRSELSSFEEGLSQHAIGSLRKAALDAVIASRQISVRTCVGALSCFLDLVNEVEEETLRIQNATPRILRTVFAVWLELATDANRRSLVQRVFELGGNDIVLYMNNAGQGDVQAREFSNERLDSGTYPAIRSKALLKFVLDSSCDFKKLNAELRDLLVPITDAMAAEDVLLHYRRAKQADFESALEIVLAKLRDSQYNSLQELARLAETLFHLRSKSLVTLPEDELAGLFFSAARDVAEKILASPQPHAPIDESVLGLPQSNLHSRVLENLKLSSRRVDAKNYEKKKQQLFSWITLDPAAFTAALSDIREPFARGALFTSDHDAHQAADQLGRLFVTDGAETEVLHSIIKAFKRRYAPEDMASIVESERRALEKLSERLRFTAHVLDNSRSLARAALLELIEVLNQAAKVSQ